ncbi:hypothetical protein L226DRAFT_571167 [Lentinus tigrinus ALCF2SS1-7]|uniref:Uncharacterized protein n=1 Tax=Lentinus tigrinus ALCF2SS1-6 TaxID=1328759 RepID=A0A5C2S8X6_9APHY|nr:hypothetical protein L227DRAFT_653662 [Lentinus tigrinus ALCF2SS1-6]RPD74907.1 hypothetical protein L226DRAFT_571167 [Lentinus tigrinus ALCF2SS1-7]
MQIFYKFFFLASFLAFVTAAPAVSLEDAVTPSPAGCTSRRDSDTVFNPDECF